VVVQAPLLSLYPFVSVSGYKQRCQEKSLHMASVDKALTVHSKEAVVEKDG